MPSQGLFRDRLLRALVLFGFTLFLLTEGLSFFSLLKPRPLRIAWSILAGAVFIRIAVSRRTARRPVSSSDPVVLICLGGILPVLALTAVTAAFSPPNSADTMAYHMPRVFYWAEQGSVRFFSTAFFNQIMLQPFAEYFMLHVYLLSDGDHFINFVQWFASCFSIVAVSSIALLLGAGLRGQAIAALFCATLPSGILASSGAKNDYFMAMWLAAAVYFAGRFARQLQLLDAAFSGAALGLALLTKATAYLYAPWLFAAILAAPLLRNRGRAASGSLLMLAVACAINTPQYARNYALSGSIMGFDSAHGDGFFRWRNERFGWKQTTSNILRNLSEQLGSRSQRWNQNVFDSVVEAHRWIGIGINDPDTTWRWITFEPPKNANHEANAPSRWQLLILAVLVSILGWRAFWGRDRQRALYAAALVCGFFALCAYLKWQPFLARLFLPLFVLGSPLAGMLEELKPALLQIALCLFLLNNARPAVLENWVRPLKGPRSVLHLPRDDQYFADLSEFHNQSTYTKTVDLLAGTNCAVIGLDITHNPLEYPIQALLRERKPEALFLHSGTQNVSMRYAPPVHAPPCAVVCLDCIGDAQRLSSYAAFPKRIDLDKFVIFLRQ